MKYADRIRLSDIFTVDGQLTEWALSLDWPEQVWVYVAYSKYEFINQFINSSFNNPMHYHIVHLILYCISDHREQPYMQKVLGVTNVIKQWNQIIIYEYNIAMSMLGYTDNQYDNINAAVQVLKDNNFFHRPVTFYKRGSRYAPLIRKRK